MREKSLTRRQRDVLLHIQNTDTPLEYSFRGWGKSSSEMRTIHERKRPIVNERRVSKSTLESLFKKGYVEREIIISRKDMIGNLRYIKHTVLYSAE